MKKIFYLVFTIIVLLTACKKEVPKKKPQACANADKTLADTKTRITFTSGCSEDGNNYSWDFGDGNTSNNFAAFHYYSQPGTYNVTLTVTNELGSDKETIVITIGERYVSKIIVKEISFLNDNGQAWDEDGSGPDLSFNFRDSETKLGFTTETIMDVKQVQLPLTFLPKNPTDWKATDILWEIRLYDMDEINSQITGYWKINVYESDISYFVLEGDDKTIYNIEVHWEVR